MTTYTQTQLATRVLKDLGLVGADETPSSSDQEWAEQTVQAELSLLAGKGINIMNSEDEIDQAYFTTISRRIGLAVAPSFGLSDVATATLAMPAVENDLRIIGAVQPTYAVAENDHF